MVFDAMHGISRNYVTTGGQLGTTQDENSLVLVDCTGSYESGGGGGGVGSTQVQSMAGSKSDGWREPLLKSNDVGIVKKEERCGEVKISLPILVRTEPKFPKEKLKTLLSLLFLLAGCTLNTVSLAIVHDRLPDRDKYAPLPDIFFDLFPPQDWALNVSEFLIMISLASCLLLMSLHKHRYILLRRCFLIMGLLYLMRSITMLVTQVPIASTTYYCSPKANTTSPAIVAKRVIRLLSGFGLSVNGQHVYCGDYIYSGHTIVLTLSFLMIQEYTSKRCVLLHWLSWTVSATGVVFVLLSRGHYTIDVIIAYYVTTRLFWMYHTLANNPDMKVSGPNNYLSRLWWFSLFIFFEKNVRDKVPRELEWPVSWPRRSSKRDRNS